MTCSDIAERRVSALDARRSKFAAVGTSSCRLRPAGLLLLAFLACFGCSRLDFSNPTATPLGDIMDSGRPYDDGAAAARAQHRAAKLAEAVAAWQRSRAGVVEGYDIGSGDVLRVGVLDLEKPGVESRLEVEVGDDGAVELALVGKVAVAGVSPEEAKRRICAAYEGKYLKSPKVSVALSEPRSKPVIVTGEVAKPGIYYLNKNTSSLLEILLLAGGLAAGAGDEVIVAHGNPAVVTNVSDTAQATGTNVEESAEVTRQDVVTVDVRRLLDEGDLSVNVAVRGGDIVTVPAGKKKYVHVLGYVARPGAFPTEGGDEMEVMHALALAGGLQPAGRAENSFVLKKSASGQKVVPVDLTKIARGVRPTFNLRAGDTLVVGTGFFARLSEFIRPVFSAGASYTPTLAP